MMYPNNASEFLPHRFAPPRTLPSSLLTLVRPGIRFSFTDMRNKDILPNTNMSRDNFNLRVNTSAGSCRLRLHRQLYSCRM